MVFAGLPGQSSGSITTRSRLNSLLRGVSGVVVVEAHRPLGVRDVGGNQHEGEGGDETEERHVDRDKLQVTSDKFKVKFGARSSGTFVTCNL